MTIKKYGKSMKAKFTKKSIGEVYIYFFVNFSLMISLFFRTPLHFAASHQSAKVKIITNYHKSQE